MQLGDHTSISLKQLGEHNSKPHLYEVNFFFDIIKTTKRAQLIETTLEIVRRTYLETIKIIEMTKRS
jgi:hypothetical protein